MGRLDDLIAAIRKRPTDMSFNDVRALLELSDWTFARQKGSHTTFTKPGERPLIIPIKTRNKVIQVYLDRIRQTLNLDDKEPD